MESPFIRRLIQERETRGWSQRELGRRAGISGALISQVESGVQSPTADFCLKIADALDVPGDEMLRCAGHLPPVPPYQHHHRLIHDAVSGVPPDRLEAALLMLRGLAAEATPPSLTPALARPQEEERIEMDETPKLLGKAIYDLNHPIRQLYEALVDVLSEEQLIRLITRLAEMAAENRAKLGQQDNDSEHENSGVAALPGRHRGAGRCNE